MEDLAQTIQSLGGLHDARIVKLTWHGEKRRLELAIDDLYANSEGLPDYKGPKEAVITFEGVQRLDLQLDLGEAGLMVYDCTVTSNAGGTYSTDVSFSPGGRVSVTSEAPSVGA